MDIDLSKDTNTDLNTEPDYITDKKFRLKLKFKLNKKKLLKYNRDEEIKNIIKLNEKNKKGDDAPVLKIIKGKCNKQINKIIRVNKNNKVYLHNEICYTYKQKKQFDFDYVKCRNPKCNVYYCEQCFLKSMSIKETEFEYILFKKNNKYLFKHPYNVVYKCLECDYNIAFISDKLNCSNCNYRFIKATPYIKNNKCYYCDNYICNSCKNSGTYGTIDDVLWCTKCKN